MSRPHLFAFHVGPVQDFIITARRTQDWWMGSWLLSHLSYTAMKAAMDKGADLVLPKELPPPTETADTTNHFLARFLDTQLDPSGVAQAVETAVQSEWICIEQKVKAEFFSTSVNQSLWTRQVGTFLEIYWVVVPDAEDSATARRCAQTALDARKRLRNFVPAREPHLKCTLCGGRQELSGETRIEDAREWWKTEVGKHLGRPHHKKLRIRENGNERLCAVCAVKRSAVAAEAVPLQVTDSHFPSTSSMAAAMFVTRLLETDRGQRELEAHLQLLKQKPPMGLGIPQKVDVGCIPQLAKTTLASMRQGVRDDLLKFDGDLLYTETFTEKRLAEEFPDSVNELKEQVAQTLAIDYGASTVEDARKAFGGDFEAEVAKETVKRIARSTANLRALFRAVRSDDPIQHIPQPSKYFAALMMDGDHMGRYYGEMETPQAREMSGQMSQFARTQAREAVEKHFGRLVYAGADDVLALLPLETTLSCAREVRTRFNGSVDTALIGVNLPEGVKRPTPSIGIAIAHHTAPLDGVLVAMQRAEKAAKNTYGRDALCVHVLKRSGEEVRVGTHWNYGDLDAVELAGRVVAALRDDTLTTLTMKFAHAVTDEARSLAGVEGDKFPLPAPARAAALKRLAQRHCGKGREAEAQSLATELASWAEGKYRDDKKPLGLEEVAQWILLARFIASEGRDDE